GEQLALLQHLGGPITMLDAKWQPTGERFGGAAAYFALDPTDNSIAYNKRPGEIVITDRPSEQLAAGTVRISVDDRPCMTYSPDGRFLATGGYARAVELWNVIDGSRVEQFAVEGTLGGLTPVFSPDGKLLVVGNRNDKTHIFSVADGKLLHVLDRR